MIKINLEDKNLSSEDILAITNILSRQNNKLDSNLQQIWYLMDLLWDDLGCDNHKLNLEKISNFYSHKIWVLNGLFIEQDDVSMKHRNSIANWIVEKNLINIVDYGGGLGTLAVLISKKKSNLNIDIYEPYPSEYLEKRIISFRNVSIVNELKSDYDCLLSTDVLEHVSDPLKNLRDMIKSVRVGGFLIIANSFYPVIKCHLPKNFHFRFTFNIFASIMGLKCNGRLEGSHATIFTKISNKNNRLVLLRFFEIISILIFPFMKIIQFIFNLVKKIIK